MPRRLFARTAPTPFALLVALACLAPMGSPLAAPASAQELPETPDAIRPLLVGATVPDVPLATSDGTETTLHAALGDGPAIVVFYRGGW